MTREEAVTLVKERVQNENLVRHMLATEAIMADLADRLGGNRDTWAMAGLLHDLDVEETADRMDVHGLRSVEWLQEAGFQDTEVLQAVRAHNPENGTVAGCLLDQVIVAADPLSGLITAAALIRPEKKLELVSLKSLKKRFREPAFARGANREGIATCEQFGLSLEEFLSIGLAAMQRIAPELGL
ncbi:MAG: HDIG domain-containing protein [Actinobacteria bacterium]|nr:HDIG domain-containing protein [Actinomycetota bacterium]